jgi:hypothetical protein
MVSDYDDVSGKEVKNAAKGNLLLSETGSLLPHLLLLGGVVGPLLFVLVIWLEGALRSGYDLLRHFDSELALGKRGWIQITNFLMAGVLVTASAFGITQVLPGSFWGSAGRGRARVALAGHLVRN